MSSRLTVIFPPSFGNRTVEVDVKRFSIGRTPENDFQIQDASLSRRHALIEEVEGRFLLSDCDSSNGTFVNGQQVFEATELADWDVLTFGGVGDVVVRIQENADQSGQVAIESASPGREAVQPSARSPRAVPSPARSTDSTGKKPIVAIAFVVVILIITGAALLISRGSKSGTTSNLTVKKQDTGTSGDDKSTNSEVAGPNDDQTNAANNSNNNGDSSELSLIESNASKVLTGISRDTRPVITEKPLRSIDSTVQRYKGSAALAEQLRAMKRALPQVAAIARSNGVRSPLVVYAALARIDRDGRGDPAQVAALVAPSLARMRVIFGDELASDSLLSVAALEEGASLQSKITKLAGRVNDSPTTIRSVWYLHDHQTISDQAYNFVLRFLALGVIAQDPQKFGVSAEPLIF